MEEWNILLTVVIQTKMLLPRETVLCMLREALLMSRLRNVGYMLICRLRAHHMPAAPLAEGNFLRGESARIRIIVGNDFSNTCTHEHTNTRIRARASCTLFKAATQWGSVSKADLAFLAWKQEVLCWCFRGFLNVSVPHSLILDF